MSQSNHHQVTINMWNNFWNIQTNWKNGRFEIETSVIMFFQLQCKQNMKAEEPLFNKSDCIVIDLFIFPLVNLWWLSLIWIAIKSSVYPIPSNIIKYKITFIFFLDIKEGLDFVSNYLNLFKKVVKRISAENK